MKRWEFSILICVILGVVTTVAVAWACTCWSLSESGSEFIGELSWQGPVPDVWPLTATHSQSRSFGIVEFEALGAAPVDANQERIRHSAQYVLIAGWPFRNLYYQRRRIELRGVTYSPFQRTRSAHWQDGIAIPAWGSAAGRCQLSRPADSPHLR